MKRLESSVYSFSLTLNRIRTLIGETLSKIDLYETHKAEKEKPIVFEEFTSENEYDSDDQNSDLFSFGTRNVRIHLEDMDRLSWRRKLEEDEETLGLLLSLVSDITAEHDTKLQDLLK